MALRSAGLQMSAGTGGRQQQQQQQPQHTQHRLSLGRNGPDAAGYGDVDAATYGSRGEALDEYQPDYDVPGESPWDKMLDKSGSVFYSNRVTGKVQWQKPVDFEDSLDVALAGAPGAPTPQELRDKEVPFLKDMVRNCPAKAFLKQFLEGPENFLRQLNENHGAEGINVFHHACMYAT